jgi:TP901 family phage tail tape measure protein
MALIGVAAVAGFGFAVKTAADFEKGLSAVAAVSGATQGELDQLRAKALQLGKDTKFSAAEAVSAMEELAKAGVSTTDILGGAADATVALAAAGEVDLTRAAEIASNAMNVFNLEASEMPHVADQIAGAANASAISVDEFAMSLQQSGAAAQLAGVTFEDLTTAIALMGNAGIKGSDAGTSLKTMLLNLNPTTAKQKNLMKELGIVTAEGANRFFDAQGNAKKMADIAGVLGGALQGMTKQQKLATLETLFGSDAIRAAAVIADAGAKGFNDLAGNISKVKAADVAAKRMDNLAGSVEQFRGSVETALIQAGAPFQHGLRQIVDAATRLVNAFTTLSPATQKLVGQFLVFGGLTLLISAGFIKMFIFMVRFGEAIKTATTLVKAFGIASKLAFLTNPVFLIIAAVIALVAILVLLFKKNETFRNAVLAAWAAIKTAIAAVVSFFTGTVVPAFQTAMQFLGDIGSRFAAAFRSILPIVQPIFAALVGIIRAGIQVIVGIVKLFAALLTGNWTAAWNAIKSIASGILSGIVNAVKLFVALIVANWQLWLSKVLSLTASFAATILGAIASFAAALPGRILFAIGFIIGRWIQFQVRMVQFAIQMGSRVLSAVVSFFSKLPGRVAGFLASALVRMVSWATNMIARARAAGSQVLAAIGSFFSQLPGRIGNFLASALTRMANFRARLPEMARAAASGVVSAISSGLAALPGIVSGAVGAAISAFQGMIGRAFSAAKSLASSLWNGFKAGLFGSPRTLIEYAMIGMTKGFGKELTRFEKQQADFARVAGAFASRDVMLRTGALAAGTSRATTVNQIISITGIENPEQVKQAMRSTGVLRPIVQAARARGA